MIPSIGRIVHYKLTSYDADEINRRRGADSSAAAIESGKWPKGAVAHAGNSAAEGDIYPMIITRIFGENPTPETVVNGQVMLDGNDTLWATSRKQGEKNGNWFQPPIVQKKEF